MLSQDSLIRQTRVRFATPSDDAVDIVPIEKGGSERKFYRVRLEHQSLILVKYNDQREENRHYVRIAEVFDALGVRAPKIYFHDEAEGLIWMEDLGERDLWSYRDESWETRRPYYQSALEEVWRLARPRVGRAGAVPVHVADRVQRGAVPVGAEVFLRELPRTLFRGPA